MTTMETTTKSKMETDLAEDYELAVRLVDESLKANSLSKGKMRSALEAGLGRAALNEPSCFWTAETDAERAVNAAGRLLRRLARQLGVQLEGPSGATAMNVAKALLE
jgi:hypothetical protein